jgi:solute carrier family 26 (sodium-independent sulfate anion transporter), member 11
LKSKCGVRTPLAGVVTGIVVLVALYGLTEAFYWIPNAGLSAVIIHAVADLVTPPSRVYSFWRISPLEFVIWLAAVLITVFTNIENGIYTSVGASVVLLLIRVAHPRRKFLGQVPVRIEKEGSIHSRNVYVPLENDGYINPNIKVIPPSPHTIIYRMHESFIYPNASIADSDLIDYVRENFRRGVDMTNISKSDRAWNDPPPAPGSVAVDLPDLRAIVLDFATV